MIGGAELYLVYVRFMIGWLVVHLECPYADEDRLQRQCKHLEYCWQLCEGRRFENELARTPKKLRDQVKLIDCQACYRQKRCGELAADSVEAYKGGVQVWREINIDTGRHEITPVEQFGLPGACPPAKAYANGKLSRRPDARGRRVDPEGEDQTVKGEGEEIPLTTWMLGHADDDSEDSPGNNYRLTDTDPVYVVAEKSPDQFVVMYRDKPFPDDSKPIVHALGHVDIEKVRQADKYCFKVVMCAGNPGYWKNPITGELEKFDLELTGNRPRAVPGYVIEGVVIEFGQYKDFGMWGQTYCTYKQGFYEVIPKMGIACFKDKEIAELWREEVRRQPHLAKVSHGYRRARHHEPNPLKQSRPMKPMVTTALLKKRSRKRSDDGITEELSLYDDSYVAEVRQEILDEVNGSPKITPRQREIFIRYFNGDMTQREVADAIGKSRQYVNKVVGKVRKKITSNQK